MGLVVKDLDRMVKFYTQELGLTILRQMKSVAPVSGDHTGIPGADRELIFVGVEGIYQIELVHYKNPPARSGYLDKHQLGASHICFNVIDLRETYRILVKKEFILLQSQSFVLGENLVSLESSMLRILKGIG